MKLWRLLWRKMDAFLKLMVSDITPSPSPLTPVHTLAFIDLETTGLPYDVGRRNVHITELSVVAVDRNHFEYDFTLRVLHKLNIFIKPRASISYGASSVTGLYDDMLEFQKPFDESVLKILEVFFSRLRSPICLIAHNGNRFDFPLLQAEFKRLGLSLPPDITCADTLQAFKTFGYVSPANLKASGKTNEAPAKPPSQNHNVKTNCVPPVSPDFSPVEVDNMLDEDIDTFKQIDPTLLTPEKHENNHFITDGNRQVPFIYRIVNEESNDMVPFIYNDKTPNIKTHFRVKKLKQEHNSKKTEASKRKLFDSTNKNISTSSNAPSDHSKPPIIKKQGFSLEKLYVHYFGEKPNESHHADADCINLCKICQKVNHEFLPWLDSNQVPFAQIPSMW